MAFYCSFHDFTKQALLNMCQQLLSNKDTDFSNIASVKFHMSEELVSPVIQRQTLTTETVFPWGNSQSKCFHSLTDSTANQHADLAAGKGKIEPSVRAAVGRLGGQRLTDSLMAEH